MNPTIPCAILLQVLSLIHSHPVRAERPSARVVVTKLTMGGVNRADQKVLASSLYGGLTGAGLRVFSDRRAHKALGGQSALLGCETNVCLKRIGELLETPLCANAVIEDSGGGTYRLELTITQASNGKRLAYQTRQCAPCTTREAAEALSQAAKAAGAAALARFRAGSDVTPRPPPRRHARRRSPNGDGRTKTAAASPGRTLLTTGIALIATGVAATTTGAVLWGLDDHTTGCDQPLTRVCRFDTKLGGITGTVLGAATAATGVALLIYGLLKKKAPPPLSMTFDPRQGAVLLQGHLTF